MSSQKIAYFLSFLILIIGLAISVYLLFQHFSIISGEAHKTDLCSVIFGKGCTNTSFSSLSTLLNIPLAGWGLIYITILGLLLSIDLWLTNYFKKELIIVAFWISMVGISFSIFFLVYMILHPVFFCPFCLIFHVLNIILFLIIKKNTNHSYLDLIYSLIDAIKYVVLGKHPKTVFEKWKWLAYIIPFIIALVLYQWIRIEGLGQTNSRLASYDPLEQLVTFDAQPAFEINLTAKNPVLGFSEAPVTLIVFSDFQCSNCSMFAANFSELIKYNKDRLNIRFKYFPLNAECNPLVDTDINSHACLAAYAAESANQQGKFWEYHDSLFTKDPNSFSDDSFYEVAKLIDLDLKKFTFDLKSEECQRQIANDIAEGIQLGLDGTPSVFLNGKRVYDLRPNNLNFLIRYLSNNISAPPNKDITK
jgi:protein-disulfide isomerase/uncharacterized membrane protein